MRMATSTRQIVDKGRETQGQRAAAGFHSIEGELEKRLFARLPRTRLLEDVREAVAGQ